MKNQARVYEAEQAEIAERKKTAARLQEIKEERAKEELQSELEKAGGKPRLNRVDWMYEGPSNGQAGTSEELEGFLLGKRRIDNLLTRGSEQESLKKPVGPGPDIAVAPKLNERDTAAKLREDPLLAIKRKEQEAYEAMVSDPIRRQQLLASMGKTEERHSSRKKDDRHSRKHRHRSHSREHRHRRHRRSDSKDRDSERRHRHRRSDSRERSTSRNRYESRKSRHHERSGRGRSESPERSRDHDRSRRERSRSPRRSGYDDREERSSRRHDNSEDAPRGRRRYDTNNDNGDRRDARDGKYNDRRRNERYGGNSGGGGGASSNAAADAEERARKLAAMQANASDLDQDRNKRLAALEEKERLAREADDKARERSGKYGDKEFSHGLRRQLIK